MSAPEKPMPHDWIAGVRNGMPVLLCQRGNCRMAWWPDRREPKPTCTGERRPRTDARAVVTARLDRADHGPTLRDLLSRSSLGCPRKPISCGHMLVDHGDGWDDDGAPTNPACRVRGCDCDGVS